MSELSPNERVSAWEALEENGAWKELSTVLEAQIRSREQEILHGVLTPENIYDREKLRGECAGLLLAQQLAKELHELAVQDVQLMAKEKDNV